MQMSSASEIDLSDCQRAALDDVLAGESIFLTGMAGSGKSFVVRALTEIMGDASITRTATTGCAATAIGGQTLHSVFGLRPCSEKTRTEFELTIGHSLERCNCVCGKVATLDRRVSALVGARHKPGCRLWPLLRMRTLVVEEASMLSPFLFGAIDCIMRALRDRGKLFGGVRLLMLGDHAQLPPVSTSAPREIGKRARREHDLQDVGVAVASEWACSAAHGVLTAPDAPPTVDWIASAYERTLGHRYLFQHPDVQQLKVHELRVNFRQREDPRFQSILERIRYAKPLDDDDKQLLATRTVTLMPSPLTIDPRATVLFARRAPAFAYNQMVREIDRARYPENGAVVRMQSTFVVRGRRELTSTAVRQRLCNSVCESEILVRRGDRVLVTRNLCTGVYNGLSGRVVGIGFVDGVTRSRVLPAPSSDLLEYLESSVHGYREDVESANASSSDTLDRESIPGRIVVIVQSSDGSLIVVAPSTHESPSTSGVIEHRQFAIAPAGALTVHKSQGMTLDAVVFDVSHAHEPGLVYVGCTRARRLDDLTIVSADGTLPVVPCPDVCAYYESLKK